MEKYKDLINVMEVHGVGELREHFASGVDPNATYQGKSLFDYLISMYTRTPRFKECVTAFLDHGLDFPDQTLLAVLRDDAESLNQQLEQDPTLIAKIYDLDVAYTPLQGATLMHICAEFNHVACAKVLLQHGADVNAQAGLDAHGFGGQTPIFHTVNQNGHQSRDMLLFLVENNADLQLTVQGIIWGKGYEWETLIPSVNPISYAMMGLLPQMHREEQVISGVVNMLLRKAYGLDYAPRNIPNEYLKP